MTKGGLLFPTREFNIFFYNLADENIQLYWLSLSVDTALLPRL